MCNYQIIELHNPSTTGSKVQGSLAPSDNTLYYNEKVAITSNTYRSIFKCSCKQSRRLAILKIIYRDRNCRKYTIWRAANTKGVTGITDSTIGLPFDALWELHATPVDNNTTAEVTKGCWLPFFLNHPNHAARISTRIGLVSMLLAVIGIIVSYVLHFYF